MAKTSKHNHVVPLKATAHSNNNSTKQFGLSLKTVNNAMKGYNESRPTSTKRIAARIRSVRLKRIVDTVSKMCPETRVVACGR